MYRLARTLLFLLPAELAHHLGMAVLRLISLWPRLCRWLRRRALVRSPSLAVQAAGLHFEHPIALAAGLDKDARAISGLFALGFSAVEVGTLTPRPQPGNPRPRLFRLPEVRALINRMGMNNHGARAGAARLANSSWRPGPVGVNVGKNAETPLDRAVEDYQAAARTLAPFGDYLVLNASSPNTPGLRKLQAPDALQTLLRGVRATLNEVAPDLPLFLKIAPDLAPEAVDAVVDIAVAEGVVGLIATNTTLERPIEHPLAAESGGLSGAPLRDLSLSVLRRAHRRAAGRLVLIAGGGVITARDAYDRIRAGASLVQIYTGLIYEGPGLVKRLVRELAALLHEDGLQTVAQAVGRDAAPP